MSGLQRDEDRYLLAALPFEGLLLRVIRRYSHNDSDVEEILNETYMRLLEAGHEKEKVVKSVPAFAVTIAYHLAIDRLRRDEQCAIDPDGLTTVLEWVDGQAPLDETLDREQTLARLRTALQGFSRPCQQVLWLRWFSGLTITEIAVRLGLGEDGVKYHLKSAARAFPHVLFRGRDPGAPIAARDVSPPTEENP